MMFQVTLYHILKLFQTPVTEGTPATVGRALVSEAYEEIVFQEPTQLMQHLLTSVKPLTNGTWNHETDCKYFNLLYNTLISVYYPRTIDYLYRFWNKFLGPSAIHFSSHFDINKSIQNQ